MIRGIMQCAGVAVVMSTSVLGAVNILPRPLELEVEDGAYILTQRTSIVWKGDGAEPVAQYLASVLKPGTGYQLKITTVASGAAGSITLQIGASSDLGDEGYTLDSSARGVTIKANTARGLFYGVQTLRQLLPAAVMGASTATHEKWTVPAVSITDKPRFPWRGMHLDVGRHYFPVKDIKKYIDLIAFYKMNTFHWHLTEDQGWRLEIKKYPRLTEVGSIRAESPKRGNRNQGDGKQYGPFFYTQDDVREIVAYAASRHITVVPEIELPGHSLAALVAYPDLGCTGGPYKVRTRWGVEPDIYCAGNEKVFAFLEDVLDETLDLFPSEFIHIGGDEAPKQRWDACPKCQARIEAEGLHNSHELQSYFIRRIETYLNEKGRRLIGWDEILEGGLAPNASVMSWRGVNGGIAAAKQGHDVVMSPVAYCYFCLCQGKNRSKEPEGFGQYLPTKKVYSFEPIPGELSADQAKHVLGAQGNVWTEFIRDYPLVEYMAVPRMIALSEVVWSSKEEKDYDNFVARLTPHLAHLDVAEVNYRKLDKELPVVGRWRSGEPSQTWSTREWDVTKAVNEPGDYHATFQYTDGHCRLDMRQVELLVNDRSVSMDDHQGTTGAHNKDHVYRLKLAELPSGAKVTLKAQIRSDGGVDSNGEIYLNKD